jgi:hypothetical protein
MLGNVNLNGQPVTGARKARFELTHRDAATGRFNGLLVTMELDPTAGPSAQGFQLSTNGDGSEKFFDGSVEMRDTLRNVTYVVSFTQASLRRYGSTVATDGRARQRWGIFARQFTVSAGGDPVEFASNLALRQVLGPA